MIRFSDLGPILAAVLLASPARGDMLFSDAFGLYDPATSAPERRDWAGWVQGDDPTVILPHGPDRLAIFAGPKSSVAGKDQSHVVAIVLDRFGNLVADGTPALVAVQATPTATETRGGLAELLLAPRREAADLFVGVTAGQRQSPQAMLSIVADIASIRPSFGEALAEVATGMPFEVRSAPLADQYGNPVPQGTGALVILRHADGSHSLGSGFAMQHSALIRLIARDIPGPAEAAITLGAQTSGRVALSVRTPKPAGLPALELSALPDIGALRVTFGPFLTTDGYALQDGAQVTVTADLAGGTRVTDAAWVQDGEIGLMLPIGTPSEVTRLLLSSPLGLMDLTASWHAASAAATEPGP